MQDWIENRGESAVKTTGRFFVAIALSVALAGCAAASLGQAKTDAGVMVANYTNDYVELSLLSPSGRKIGIGEDAKPFSEGGPVVGLAARWSLPLVRLCEWN